MTKQESKRPERLGTRVLKIDLADEEAVRHMFDYGLPRKTRKESVSKIREAVRGRHQDEASTLGTHRHGPSGRRP